MHSGFNLGLSSLSRLSWVQSAEVQLAEDTGSLKKSSPEVPPHVYFYKEMRSCGAAELIMDVGVSHIPSCGEDVSIEGTRNTFVVL